MNARRICDSEYREAVRDGVLAGLYVLARAGAWGFAGFLLLVVANRAVSVIGG